MNSRSRFLKPKSTRVLEFCRSMGVEDPVRAIRQSVRRLVEELELDKPPFDPHKYAAACGVRKVVRTDMALDGRLVFSNGGFEIYVRSSHSEQRQNFTIAHETAHTFFLASQVKGKLDRAESGIGYFTDDDEEEYLCDMAAAEMLMPEQCFTERLFAYGPSVRSILRMSGEFRVSLHALALRMKELGQWKVLITKWAQKKDVLEPEWSYPSKGLRLGMHEWLLAPRGPIHRSLEKGYAVGKETLRFQNGEETYLVESKRINGGALAVLIAERHGEYLLPMFDRACSSRQKMLWAEKS